MNRRGFLRSLLMGTAGAVGLVAGAELDLDKLLWVPGAKTIFLPPAPTLEPAIFEVGCVAPGSVLASGNSLVTLEWLAEECAAIFENSLNTVRYVNREYGTQYGKQSLALRLPRRFETYAQS